jgi:hypothetical protein
MTLRGRLQKVERTLDASGLLAGKLQYQLRRAFYEMALEVLEPFREAHREVERRIAASEQSMFGPDRRRTVAVGHAQFCYCTETLWTALAEYPEARQALDEFLNEACGNEEEGTADNVEESHQSE